MTVGVTITGTSGDDTVDATHTPNGQALPTNNDDTIFGLGGNDHLSGLDGDDFIRGGDGNDTIDGGNGIDTADYSDKLLSTQTVVVTLNGATSATVTVGLVAEDTLRNIENVTGGAADDALTGDGNANVLQGGGGDDVLRGGLGSDVLDGGAGEDRADYGDKVAAVSVTLNGASDAAVSVGASPEDTIRNIEDVYGGTAADVLTGDANANVLIGRDGDDQLSGGDGNDVLQGGDNNDVLDGGNGDDTADYSDKSAAVAVTLTGATFATVTVGVSAEDTIRNIENINGGGGADTLTGDDNANTFKGGAGDDILDGGNGVDTADYSEKVAAVVVTLTGAVQANVKVGGTDEDKIRNIENVFGGSGADTLTGDGNGNVLLGLDGADILSGGGGDDLLRGGVGADTLDGGQGNDIADYREKTDGVAVVLAGGASATVMVKGVAEDTVKNIENVYGGSGGDGLTGDGLANTLLGNDGNDVLKGGGGGDFLQGGRGRDMIDGGAGLDVADYGDKFVAVRVTLNGAGNVIVKVAGVAEDTIRNVENVYGGIAADVLTGDAKANVFIGRAGADVLNGGAGNDVLQGGVGHDKLDGGAGIDTADYSDRPVAVHVVLNGAANAVVTVGGGAEDTVRNIEDVVGGAAADSFVGDANANALLGEGGSDVLNGGAGNDYLRGGAGADRLFGGTGLDAFAFVATSDSRPGGHDVINDFNQFDQDRIDLSAIDADLTRPGNQAFTFIRGDSFAHYHATHPGVFAMVRYAGGLVQANVDANLAADFEVAIAHPKLMGGIAVTDFVL